jgi:hypothetical protein
MRIAFGGKNKFDFVDGSILVPTEFDHIVSRRGIVAICLCIRGL